MADELRKLRAALDEYGLLPQHDPELASATSIIAGEHIRGSWWGHPAGGLIFDVLTSIEDEVATVKLLGGKITLVHRRLFAALGSIGRAAASAPPELRRDAAFLFARTVADGHLRTDAIDLPSGSRKTGVVANEIERALLVYSTQEHTESGRHARVLVTWDNFLRENGIEDHALPPPSDARRRLDAAAERIGAFDRLPWNARSKGADTKARPKRSRKRE